MQNDIFGVYLKEKRTQRHLSLRELARKSGIAHTYLRNIEKGIKPPPSDKILLQLEKSLLLDEASKVIFYDIAAQVKKLLIKTLFTYRQIFQVI